MSVETIDAVVHAITRRAWYLIRPRMGQQMRPGVQAGDGEHSRRECELGAPFRTAWRRGSQRALGAGSVLRRQRVDADAAAGEQRDRLRSECAQCPEDRADVNLDRSLREREVAADEIVRLALTVSFSTSVCRAVSPSPGDMYAVARRHGARRTAGTRRRRTCRRLLQDRGIRSSG